MYDGEDLDIKSLKRDLPELFRPEYDGGYLLDNGEIDWKSMKRDLPELFKPYFDGGYLLEEDIYSSSSIDSSIPSISEMKNILYNKLQDEGTNFSKSDIIINKEEDSYTFEIAGYEPTWFSMTFEYDDYFGYCVYIDEWYDQSQEENIAFVTRKNGYDVKQAIIELGYYIGTRF